MRPHPCASSYSTARVDRALAPPKLHRQHFARSSYRCGIRLTGSCNSIFKDEHPSLHRLLRPYGQSELRISRRSAHFGYRDQARCRRCLPIRTAALAASGAPRPLPRRRVNAAGFNARSEHLRSTRAAASPSLGFHRALAWPEQPRHQPQPTACPNEHDYTHRLLQSTQSSSTLANDR